MDDSDKIKLYAAKVEYLEQENAAKDQKILDLEKLNSDLINKLEEKLIITAPEKDALSLK